MLSRSLLFGGMLPLTMVGTGVSSLVPWPNESSVDPDGLSALRCSLTFAQSRAGGATPSTLRFPSVISKLLPGRGAVDAANVKTSPAANAASVAHIMGRRRREPLRRSVMRIVLLRHRMSVVAPQHPRGCTPVRRFQSPLLSRCGAMPFPQDEECRPQPGTLGRRAAPEQRRFRLFSP